MVGKSKLNIDKVYIWIVGNIMVDNKCCRRYNSSTYVSYHSQNTFLEVNRCITISCIYWQQSLGNMDNLLHYPTPVKKFALTFSDLTNPTPRGKTFTLQSN